MVGGGLVESPARRPAGEGLHAMGLRPWSTWSAAFNLFPGTPPSIWLPSPIAHSPAPTRTAHPAHRRRAPGRDREPLAVALDDRMSRFIACPACGHPVHVALVNDHLDGGCATFSAMNRKDKEVHAKRRKVECQPASASAPDHIPLPHASTNPASAPTPAPLPHPSIDARRSINEALQPQRAAAFDERARFRASPTAVRQRPKARAALAHDRCSRAPCDRSLGAR
jgi:hypothetical protein